MATRLPPWKLRSADFASPGWHARPTVAFELMFEFLRLSPSYELARKAAEEGLTVDDRQRLPADFDEIERVYGLLGNVQTVLFRTWWLRNGLKVFGNPSAKPKVHEIAVLPGGGDIPASEVTPSLERYLEEARRDEGLVGALVVALPVGGRKSEVLRQIGRLLDQHAGSAATVDKPLISIQGQRLRATVLFNGVRLLWIRAARPKWQHWRLGAKARISPTYSRELNPDAPRKVGSDQEMVDREMMSKITHRALLKFEAIAENAARGWFPSEAAVEQLTFDYPKLAKIIQRKNAWESKEKARLLKAFQAREDRRKADQQVET